ncbi:HNH endonuclease [Burkholderia sp. AU19243]|nr:HNH endonuclease [Burkholderia vietnamiensis]MBR8364918.1 HNH endonuclease [Burkholderia sp. AU19243]
MKEIPLTRGKVAIVDDEDFEHLLRFKWYAARYVNKSGELWYAYRAATNAVTGRQTSIQMQREIMRPEDGYVVRFRNSDGLDNRRENLEILTKSAANRHLRVRPRQLPKGVKAAHSKNGFVATISVENWPIHLGTFETPEAASASYQAARCLYLDQEPVPPSPPRGIHE